MATICPVSSSSLQGRPPASPFLGQAALPSVLCFLPPLPSPGSLRNWAVNVPVGTYAANAIPGRGAKDAFGRLR